MSLKLLISTLLLGLIISCGKKTQENESDNNQTGLHFTEAEVNFYLSNEINRCIESNDTVALKKILDRKRDIKFNELGHDGETLLTKALSLKHEGAAKQLISAGADINASNINGETPLIIAINNKLPRTIQDLVNRGADLNKKDIFGDTALILALKKKDQHLAMYLIEKGASILTNDRYGRSPYSLSTLYELEAVSEKIKSLLEERFGEPSREEFRDQILNEDFKFLARTLSRFSHLALQYEEINPLSLLSFRDNEEEMIEGAKLFIRWGTKVDGPPGIATNPPIVDALINLRFRYVDFLIEKNANVNISSYDGYYPLSYAIKLNDPNIVSKLFSKGAKKKIGQFDACSLVKEISSELSSASEKQKNKQIKKILYCSFFNWL